MPLARIFDSDVLGAEAVVEWYRGEIEHAKDMAAYSGPLHITCIATYVPTISTTERTIEEVLAGLDAQWVLLNIAYLANQLGSPCMEIVTGGRLRPLATEEDEPAHLEYVPTERRDCLIRRLAEIAQHLPDLRVRLAIEAEPDLDRLHCSFREVFDTLAILDRHLTLADRRRDSDYIGLNVDLGHAIAGRYDTECLRDHPERVANYHCSDHPLGHGADVPIGEWTDLSIFKSFARPLVDFISLHQTDVTRPVYSNSVSVELESCGSVQQVRDCWTRLRSVFG